MMTPEKHLAAILAAWNHTDGRDISDEMADALELAEKDFDGVEADDFDIDFNQTAVLVTDPYRPGVKDYTPCSKTESHMAHKWSEDPQGPKDLVCPGFILRRRNG